MAPGFSPLDERLRLLPGSALTPWLVESMVRLGACLPFEQVPALLAHFTGVTVGVETVRRLTEAAGTAQVAVETAAVDHLARVLPDPPAGPPVQQLSVDGAMVPLVGGEWAEAKTLVIGAVQAAASGEPGRTRDLSYFSRLTDADTFGWLATGETHRRGTATAGRVVAVVDGADWCQGFIDLHRPDAVRILDFPHAVSYLSATAQATFGPGTAATSKWLADQVQQLRHGDPDRVLTAVAALPTGHAGDVVAAMAAQATAVRYLTERRAQIQYATFLAQGYPIGSGIVESANKLVVEARLKGAGMHWARRNVNPMLALRTLVANNRWAEGWPGLWDAWRGHGRDRAAPRRQARQPMVAPTPAPQTAPPPPATVRPKTIISGKPTPDHAWRRSSPFRAKR